MRLSKADRERIIRAYLSEGKEAADKLAASFGLSENYAYKVCNARGLLPLRDERKRNEYEKRLAAE